MCIPEFLTTVHNEGQAGTRLIQYLQEQSPDTLQRVARSASGEIQDIIRHNVQGLLGMLPGEHFEVKVTANRDNLANMLASAMMTGLLPPPDGAAQGVGGKPLC